MRIALAASPLPGLRSGEVADIVRRGWVSRRPGDEFDVRQVSDAVAEPYSGSGLADMLGLDEPAQLGGAAARRFAWVGRSQVLLDYTAGLPESSASVGGDIAWALGSRAREVFLALPVMAPAGDLGAGMIGHLAGRGGSVPAGSETGPGPGGGAAEAGRVRRADVQDEAARRADVQDEAARAEQDRRAAATPQGDREEMTAMLDEARKAVASAHLTAFVGGEQRLLGMSGLARAWMRRGTDAARAQTLEARTSEAAARMRRAFEGLSRPGLLGGSLEPGPYDGAGGGLALGLRALGGRVLPVRQAVSLALDSWASGADLCIYVSGSVGQWLPDGLNAAVEHARGEGVPIVLLYDAGGVRRGELARLGLNAAYEIRPELAFSEQTETPDTASGLSARLWQAAERLATTWGWD
ncbi:MAG: hypothetical protein Q3979_06665 [Actinomycetaceae bacterium]|nr:hypothetical protein [Actinomycetaceae bacterium]